MAIPRDGYQDSADDNVIEEVIVATPTRSKGPVFPLWDTASSAVGMDSCRTVALAGAGSALTAAANCVCGSGMSAARAKSAAAGRSPRRGEASCIDVRPTCG